MKEFFFEWSASKAALNKRKHRVSFEEATTVFADVWSRTIHDPDHSHDEDRFITLGRSGSQRLLVVIHTDREGRIRIISARRPMARERRIYEERSEED